MKTELFAKNSLGETVLIQLSEDSPISMNLSIATLDPFIPQSYYSQRFIVPGQGTNGQFFKDVYSVNGTSFNAGASAEAWINTNGFLFSVGNLNLETVYVNEKLGTIEYEVFFLGDTYDFLQSVGDSFMDTINTDELNHELTREAITTSWQADPGTPAGLKEGNVLYPLIEWGYNYDSSNYPTNTTLSVGYAKGSTGDYGGSFTNGTNSPLELTQLKPAVRVKWIWDKIFEDAGYTYESTFLNSKMFDRMYMVSDSAARPFQEIQAGLCRVQGPAFDTFVDPDAINRMVFDNPLDNRDLAYDTAANKWVAPGTGLYSFKLSGKIGTQFYTYGYPQASIIVSLRLNDVVVATTGIIQSLPVGSTTDPWFINDWSLDYDAFLSKDDYLTVTWQQMSYGNNQGFVLEPTFVCDDAPDLVIVKSFFPPEGTVKRIDFIKGLSTMFNFVFEPSKVSEKSFRIEPWSQWINGGSTDDWTELLDGSVDIQQSPSFLERAKILNFAGKEDQDIQSEIYQQQFKKTYDYREFNSNISVITGSEDVQIPFGSTPLQSIPSKTLQFPDWVFPTLGKLQPGDPSQNRAGKVQPIQPQPRIMFYNGLKDNPINWYLQDVPGGLIGSPQTQYPLVSPYNHWPPQNLGTPDDPQLELTFKSKEALWSDKSTYVTPVNNDLYTVYWKDWTNWLYDPYNRVVKGKFRLDPFDIQQLQFNSKIWVKDAWYFIREISNYIVGDTSLCDVEMIKVPDRVIPRIGGATGAYGGECKSFSICNNNALLLDPVVYVYIDCEGRTQEVSIGSQSCRSICALSPLINPLPSGLTAIVNGDCVDGVFSPSGQFIFIEIGVTGSSFGQETDTIVLASTGGATGSFTPMQYITVPGTDSFTTTFNMPDGYTGKIQLKNRFNNTGPYVAYGITLYEDSVLVGVTGGNGSIPFNGVSTYFPTPMQSGINYEGEITFIY